MTECEVCGKDVLMPFDCNYCGGCFCEEHRLPENHDCAGAPARTPLGSYQIKQRTVMEKKTSRGMVSEGDLHFEREPKHAQRRRHFKVRPWYLFLLILFIVGMVLYGLGDYYVYVLRNSGRGWELWIYSAFIMGLLGAIGLLYFERWWRRHMRRFWNG